MSEKIESIVWDYKENWKAVCEFLKNTNVTKWETLNPKEIYEGLKPDHPRYKGGVKETPMFVDHQLKLTTDIGVKYQYNHGDLIKKRDGEIVSENKNEIFSLHF